MAANYYGCESLAHTEFTCLTYSIINKRFPADRWCKPCRDRWGNSAHIDVEGKP